MSFKMHLRYQTRYFVQFLHSLALPAWMTGFKARAVLLGLVMVMGVGYLFQTNATVTAGYKIHDLENEIAAMNQENTRLATEAASYQSMTSIQARLTSLNMVPATNATVAKVGAATEVAKR